MAAMGMSSAVDQAGSLVSTLSDLQNRGKERAAQHARALADIEQAGLDADQALGDLKQATLDLAQAQVDQKQAAADADQALLDVKQAALDVSTAQADYNKAVKEHGANSAEAKQAALDLAQAQQDLKQAGVDSEQAQQDLKQATEDGAQAQRDQKQAALDAKTAQLDLNDAQREADPGAMSKLGTTIGDVSDAASGLIGTAALLAVANDAVSLSSIKAAGSLALTKVAQVAGATATGIATAAQWAWNVAMSANPIGIIIVAIGLLAAAIVWIAVKTTWFQDLWHWIWGKIGDPVKAAWDWVKRVSGEAFDWLAALPGRIGRAFLAVTEFIGRPFRAAFNAVANAWNNTVGRLHWTVPGWVPMVGGNSISAPKLPTFHRGGRVPGVPGEEVLAVLQAGENVQTAAQANGGGSVLVLQGDGSRLMALLLEIMREAIQVRGGNVQTVLGGLA